MPVDWSAYEAWDRRSHAKDPNMCECHREIPKGYTRCPVGTGCNKKPIEVGDLVVWKDAPDVPALGWVETLEDGLITLEGMTGRMYAWRVRAL